LSEVLRRRGAIFVAILIVLVICVTAFGRKPAVQTGHPAGKSLVIYWGADRDTKRAARRIASLAGAPLVDLSGKRSPPNIADYDNIFVGAPLKEGAVPLGVSNYLGKTDFLERYALLFLTSRDDSQPVLSNLSEMVKGACIVSERLFAKTRRVKQRELNAAIDFWATDVLNQVTMPTPVYRQDNPAGRSLVLYWGDSRANTRVAYEIADATDAQTFDIARGDAPDLSDLMGFDSFYVGIPLANGTVPPPLNEFLSRTDFIDGYTAVFWTGTQMPAAPIIPLLQGARIIAEQGFPDVNSLSPAELKAAVHSMTEPLITRFTAIHGAGLRAEYMMKAFALVYPDRISDVRFRDDDWAFRMDDIWYYYAGGRMLPEAEKNNIDDWRSQQIYRYAAGASYAPVQLDASRRFQFSSSWGRSAGTAQYPFYEDLLQTGTRAQASAQLRPIRLFGHTVAVHHALVTPLANVEKSVEALAKTDEEAAAWLKSLESITCWNWRNIAGSERRSYHAYGIAVDLQMRPREGFETYWQWTSRKGLDWRTLPRDKLLVPPDAVVRIFEANGFLWGGKWPLYDTMHFEYRPEILILYQ
jgi:hypothetical protein